jgi:hypothetical protein
VGVIAETSSNDASASTQDLSRAQALGEIGFTEPKREETFERAHDRCRKFQRHAGRRAVGNYTNGRMTPSASFPLDMATIREGAEGSGSDPPISLTPC